MKPPKPPWCADPSPQRVGSAEDLIDDALIDGSRFSDLQIEAEHLDLLEVSDSHFERCSLAGSSWRKPDWSNVGLSHSDLANMTHLETSWRRVDLEQCRLTGLQLPGGVLSDVTVRGCTGSLINLRQAKIRRSSFTDCQLTQFDLGEAVLEDVRFTRCDLSAAQFSGLRASRVRFEDCTFTGASGMAQLRGTQISGGDPTALADAFAESLGIDLIW